MKECNSKSDLVQLDLGTFSAQVFKYDMRVLLQLIVDKLFIYFRLLIQYTSYIKRKQETRIFPETRDCQHINVKYAASQNYIKLAKPTESRPC